MKKDHTSDRGLIPKYELAFKYFPKAATKKAATDSLTRWINRCTPLSSALAAEGYNTHEKRYTPRQVELIKQYLGDP